MRPIRSFHHRGLALVIVLIMLMLLSGLLVAFMGRVGAERVASRSLAQSFEAKQAYDTAVNLVMSQIREGTRNTTGSRAWASQPGLIWSFSDAAPAAGGFAATDEVHKLYSSDNMKLSANAYNITNSAFAAAEAGLNLSNRTDTPAGYVDLNEPVLVPVPNSHLVEAHYPIANPYAARKADGTAPDANAQAGRGIVSGFIAGSEVHPSRKKTKFGNGPEVDVLSLPMRVKWLYQLKDGTLAAANSAGVIPGATKENPPIARLAFWTDDEGGKINVNTASEYTYWDTPFATSKFESGDGPIGSVSVSGGMQTPNAFSLGLGISQPATREWQRFPGHPATTSLSPVFRWMARPEMTDLDFREAIYRLSPRLMGGRGSSMAGSRNVYYDTNLRVPKRDRLFATLDEYWFRPDRTGIDGAGLYRVFRSDSGSGMSDTQFTANLNISPESLERVRFFVTANSRSPELTLWGTPRVSMWPVHEFDLSGTNATRTPFDDLIAFCSTIAGKTYYFTRNKPWDTRYDFETANAGRNKALVDNYLRKLADKNVPGTGRSFTSKYNATVPGTNFQAIDQLLLYIYDYVRSTNLVDSSNDETSPVNTSGQVNAYPYAYTPSYAGAGTYNLRVKPNLGSGQVIPTVRYKDSTGKEPAIKGFGRFVTLSESGLLIYQDNESRIDGWDDPVPKKPDGTGDLPADDYVKLRVLLLSEMFTPSPGYPALSDGYAYSVKETKPLAISIPNSNEPEQKLDLATTGTQLINYIEVDASRIGYGRFFSPTRGIAQHFVYDRSSPVPNSQTGTPESVPLAKNTRYNKNSPPPDADGPYHLYPFFSKVIYVKKKDGQLPKSLTIKGGSLTYEIYPLRVPTAKTPPVHPLANTDQVIQRITVDFPEVTIDRIPSDANSIRNRIQTSITTTYESPSRPKNDFYVLGGGNNNIVRSLEASGTRVKGDLRLIAATGIIPPAPGINPNEYFSYSASTSTQYYHNSPEQSQVHNFRSGWGFNLGTSSSSILRGSTERNDRMAKWPRMLTTGAMAPAGDVIGDFDRGLPKFAEGAYINKPDEGNVKNGDEGGGRSIPYFLGGSGYEEVGATFYSPNRLISSPVMLGSLPTGAANSRPWETVLFSPPLSESTHAGFQQPRDHYLLDLFTMPVVEPYAISEPLSQAGKINLNYRLAPFGYIKDPKNSNRGYIERTTGIHALLTGMKAAAYKKNADNAYHRDAPHDSNDITRYDINPFDTIEKVINPRLDTRGFFRSATEICELDLLMSNTVGSTQVPTSDILTTPGEAARKAYWGDAKALTGDNQRERPYSFIYPRLTTKSNVFTVHIWAQSLSKNPSSADWSKWDDTTDRVTGEYRGSTMIERYIDQNDPALLNSGYDITRAVQATGGDLERYYRFRILNSKRFMAQ